MQNTESQLLKAVRSVRPSNRGPVYLAYKVPNELQFSKLSKNSAPTMPKNMLEELATTHATKCFFFCVGVKSLTMLRCVKVRVLE